MRSAILLFGLVLLAPAASAQFGLCALRPLEPPCCPSPCPISDPGRLPQLTQSVPSLQSLLISQGQWAAATASMAQAIGTPLPQTALADLQPLWALIASAPNGVAGAPLAASQTVKSNLFIDPDQPPTASLAANLNASRSVAAVTEARNGLALSANRISASVSPAGVAASSLPGSGAGLRADLQIGSRVRLQLLADLVLSEQLLAAEAARNQSKLALRYFMPLRGAGAQTAPAGMTTLAQGQTGSPAATVASSDDAQISAAAALLASYPALQTILDQAALSASFAQTASRDLARSLSSAGLGDLQLRELQEALRHNGSGDASLTALIGRAAAAPAAADDRVAMAMRAWLQADSQSRYWQDLAAMAASQIAALDRGLGQISDAVGYDITAVASRPIHSRR